MEKGSPTHFILESWGLFFSSVYKETDNSLLLFEQIQPKPFSGFRI